MPEYSPRCNIYWTCDQLNWYQNKFDCVLHGQGILGDLTVGELPLELVPLEVGGSPKLQLDIMEIVRWPLHTLDSTLSWQDDVLSLELEAAFRDCVVDGDSTPLFMVAKALTRLQTMFGLIPRVQVSSCPGCR